MDVWKKPSLGRLQVLGTFGKTVPLENGLGVHMGHFWPIKIKL